MRFEGVLQARSDIYLRFEGLVPEYKHHGNRMIPMLNTPIYSGYRIQATP